jgi:phosphoadenosine phosphosulfate reductase
MQLHTSGKPIDLVALERLQAFADPALSKHPDGFYLAFSGGKDSVVILDLAKRAGVPFTAHYNLTTVDPPELVRFVQATPGIHITYPPRSMWQLIAHHGGPPTRKRRWCCTDLKEVGGIGRVVLTGVRWEESPRRSRRSMVETCHRDRTKHYLHPIIDWTSADVWQYIHERALPYCSLYDEGFSRLGCILCPMHRNPNPDIARWPKLAAAWERAIKRTWSPSSDMPSPEALWRWWLSRSARRSSLSDPVLFEDDPCPLPAHRNRRGTFRADNERRRPQTQSRATHAQKGPPHD